MDDKGSLVAILKRSRRPRAGFPPKRSLSRVRP
jgi:hypothetical protein